MSSPSTTCFLEEEKNIGDEKILYEYGIVLLPFSLGILFFLIFYDRIYFIRNMLEIVGKYF